MVAKIVSSRTMARTKQHSHGVCRAASDMATLGPCVMGRPKAIRCSRGRGLQSRRPRRRWGIAVGGGPRAGARPRQRGHVQSESGLWKPLKTAAKHREVWRRVGGLVGFGGLAGGLFRMEHAGAPALHVIARYSGATPAAQAARVGKLCDHVRVRVRVFAGQVWRGVCYYVSRGQDEEVRGPVQPLACRKWLFLGKPQCSASNGSMRGSRPGTPCACACAIAPLHHGSPHRTPRL
jgi:hypothetical protein